MSPRLALAPLLAAAAVAVAGAPSPAAAAEPVECITTHGAYEPGVNCRTIEVDGAARRYLVYVPATRPPATGAPLVFMFHGSSGDGERFLRISGWREQADATGLVAVFPTGLRYRMLDSGRRVTKWNDGALRRQVDLGERPAGYPESAPFPANDVGFVDAMVGEVASALPIDHARVYASGFSNGANFTARLAAERSTLFAAAGFTAGGLQAVRTPERAIPISMALGSRDDRVLAQTDLTELPLDPVAILSEPVIGAALDTHLEALQLDPADFSARTLAHRTELQWPPRPAGEGRFRFTMIEGLGHKYPNGRNNPAHFAAARAFRSFFEANPMPAEAARNGIIAILIGLHEGRPPVPAPQASQPGAAA